MADTVEEIMRQEGRTRSELLREALRRYIEEREWRRLLRYGENRAREQGIGPQEVERLVGDYRAEAS
jgi:CopG family transcriptional regulator/antitoxin EndoAI